MIAIHVEPLTIVEQMTASSLHELEMAIRHRLDDMILFVNANPPQPNERQMAYIIRMRKTLPHNSLQFLRGAYESHTVHP